MSFIDTYIEKNRIGDITSTTRKNLDKLEDQLDTITKNSKAGLSFLDAIKDYGGEIGDLVERVQQNFNLASRPVWKFSLSNIFSNFRFVYSIAIEVYQIIVAMEDKIVPDGLTGEKAWKAKREFGKNLIYFIWKAVDPLGKSFNWVPFKKTIEKNIVMWLAGMGIDTALSLFEANKEISSFVVNNKAVSMKALPLADARWRSAASYGGW